MVELNPLPSTGRVFTGSAVARLADCSPGGRLRLDSLARVLQDVSDDDARAAGCGEMAWVVRRTVLQVTTFPAYLESLRIETWCSALGAAWAERRLRVTGDRGGAVEAATLWVHVHPEALRPLRLGAPFIEVFGPSTEGRTVGSKPLFDIEPPADARSRPWPLRFSDFDVLGHVNNAAYWAPVEEELSTRRSLRAPLSAVIEHGDAIERGADVMWSAVPRDDAVHDDAGHDDAGHDDAGHIGFDGWLHVDGRRCATIRVRRQL